MPKGCRRGTFSRGFPVPYLGALSLGGLVGLDENRLRAAPLWHYDYGVHGRDLDALLPWPYLHRLEMFALRPPLPDGWAGRLADCDNLRELDLSLAHLTREGALALARSKTLNLTRLDIQETPAAEDQTAVAALVRRFGKDAVKLRYPGQRKRR